ncbi:MAG TPA: hypothetical protein VMS35_03350 [Nitrososphaeraceae archaeon]|nr:hypothetical protein [Nitrososphaeraceae archaeon]
MLFLESAIIDLFSSARGPHSPPPVHLARTLPFESRSPATPSISS